MTRFVVDAPVAVRLATDGSGIPADHALLAPALLRSQTLALMYAAVRDGTVDARTARRVLDGVRGLRIRLLGDRVLQATAWQVATRLDRPDTYQAEYVALTQLHGDALVTFDEELARTASSLVRIAPLSELLRQ